MSEKLTAEERTIAKAFVEGTKELVPALRLAARRAEALELEHGWSILDYGDLYKSCAVLGEMVLSVIDVLESDSQKK